jgi:hypothetical protein
MIEPWMQQVVDEFWTAVGAREAFPRTLESAVLWALPLAIVKLPRLWVRDVQTWLTQRQIALAVDIPNRALHACTIAQAGKGFIFMDGTDPADERRFSLAHEVAHFLLDYLYPRQRVIRRLGTHMTEVLDGIRAPTLDERVQALLQNTPLGIHTHLMDRRSDGVLGCSRLMAAEHRADRLALELLAPMDEVWRSLMGCGRTGCFQEGFKHTVGVLIDGFGLPPPVAAAYGQALSHTWYGGPSVREWLGL